MNENNNNTVKKKNNSIKQILLNESVGLAYDNLVIGKSYFYKEICELIGATYLGTDSRPIKVQKEIWKNYIDFEEGGKKLTITGIKLFDGDQGSGHDCIASDIKEKYIRDELYKTKYYGLMYDAIILSMFEEANNKNNQNGAISDKHNNKGARAHSAHINNSKNVRWNTINGDEWVFVEQSYMKWRVTVGLISEQFRKYYNKLLGSYSGVIAENKIVNVTGDIFKNTIKRIKNSDSNLEMGSGTGILYIDLKAHLNNDDDHGFLWCGQRYKFGVCKADAQLEMAIRNCKNEIVKTMGFKSVDDVYKHKKKKEYKEALKTAIENIIFTPPGLSESEDSGDTDSGPETVKILDKSGNYIYLPRYIIVNHWETLIIGTKMRDLVAATNRIKQRVDDSAASEAAAGNIQNVFEAKLYLENIKNNINQKAVDRMLSFKGLEIKKDAANIFKNDYNEGNINQSAGGKLVRELIEIKENNKYLFDSDEWKTNGTIPIVEDGQLNIYEEDDEGRIHLNDSSVDTGIEDDCIELSDKEVIEGLKKYTGLNAGSKDRAAAVGIGDIYAEVARSLILIFGQRGKNNYNMAEKLKIRRKNDVGAIIKEIKNKNCPDVE